MKAFFLLSLLVLQYTLVAKELNEVCVSGINMKSDTSQRYLDLCIYTTKDIPIYEIKDTIFEVYCCQNFEILLTKKGLKELKKELSTKLNSLVYYSKFKTY